MFLENQVLYSEDETSLFLRWGLSCPMLWSGQKMETIISSDCLASESIWYACDQIAQAVFNLFAQVQSGRMNPIPWFKLEEHEEIFLPPCPLCWKYEDVRIPRILEIIAVPHEHSDEIYEHASSHREKFIVGTTREFAVDRWAFIFSKLHPHLIGQHGFFEGQRPYRLAPEKLIPFLQLAQLL